MALTGRNPYRWEYSFPGDGEPVASLVNPDYKILGDTKLTEFSYDSRGRLLTESTSVNGSDPAVVVYDYDALGTLASKRCGGIWRLSTKFIC